MKVAFFSAKPFDRMSFGKYDTDSGHKLIYFEQQLNEQTVYLAEGFECVCVFANDILNAVVLDGLCRKGVRLIALRCAGYNNVDITSAEQLGLVVVRVPAYSPWAVAEHAVALMMALNRRVCRANSRVREGNFSLNGLLGFELYGRSVGVVGTGRIGSIVVKILNGFGCDLLACDPQRDAGCEALGARYVSFDELVSGSDIITLHCPLMPQTRHMINRAVVDKTKTGVMLINTSRGALVDTRAVIDALKTAKIGYLGLDVYEEEADIFFKDLSDEIIQDDVLARLLTFPNVIITSHQGFFTDRALEEIARTTLANITDFAQGRACKNQITTEIITK